MNILQLCVSGYIIINLSIWVFKGALNTFHKGNVEAERVANQCPVQLNPLHSDSPFLKYPLKTPLASKGMLPVTTHLYFRAMFFYRWKCHTTKIFTVFFLQL